jgi:nucleotide-binding universal stress UspA family protein
MTIILAAIDSSPAAQPVLQSAATLAATLGVPVVALHIAHDGSEPARLLADHAGIPLRLATADRPAEAILEALNDDQVALAVIGARSHPSGPRPAGATALAVAARAGKPVVVVPPQLHGPPAPYLHRILVPLEGTSRTTLAVRQALASMATRGVELIGLHALDATTAPRFWDRPEHNHDTWSQEFAARYNPTPGGRLRLRTGRPAQAILAAAAAERADMIALGWRQDLTPPRAAVVREVLARTPVPVILLPIPMNCSQALPPAGRQAPA